MFEIVANKLCCWAISVTMIYYAVVEVYHLESQRNKDDPIYLLSKLLFL